MTTSTGKNGNSILALYEFFVRDNTHILNLKVLLRKIGSAEEEECKRISLALTKVSYKESKY